MASNTNPITGSEAGKLLASGLVAMATALITFAAGYGSLSSRVEINTKQLEQCITRREVETLSSYQRQSSADIIGRLSQIEAKLDRITEKGGNR